jgi:serine/threonine protein kinase
VGAGIGTIETANGGITVTTSEVRPASAGPASADDPRVVRALEEYIAAMESGAPPPRNEFLKRHAPVAAVLGDCLFGLEMVHHAGKARREGGPASSPGEDDSAGLGPLGDFQIVREIGRGGMGVVYEAVQRSLGRRVALKVLPLAAMMDPRHLQRFHNEARAAASLHHTNIVPVYFVGCDRGVHYYAMQYIEGQTLAALVRQLQQAAGKKAPPTAPVADADRTTAYAAPGAAASPGEDTAPAARQSTLAPSSARGREHYRRVAEWGVQAAEALEHAHQTGVVHRDVKPANLMLDAAGKLWVTDFGLAHFQQGDAGLTLTGDLVGTLRYMSPEQALAQRVVIDHRTDVYSLGATLYELLTLAPVFAGDDRQELLRQIAFEEPKSPRRRNTRIPEELDTIVLKAIEKNPADRFPTAKALADDLRRFLEDKPIHAKRPSPFARLRRWGSRHGTALWAGFMTLLVIAIVLGASNALVWWLWQGKAEALESANKAGLEKDEALRLLKLHDRELTLALEKARNQRRKSEDDYRSTLETLDGILTAVETLGSDQSPEAGRARREVDAKALVFYQSVLVDNIPGEEVPLPGAIQEDVAWAYVHLGTLLARAGEFSRAVKAFNSACDCFHSVSADYLFRERPDIEKPYREALRLCREGSPVDFASVRDYRLVLFVHAADRSPSYKLAPDEKERIRRQDEKERIRRQGLALADALAADHPRRFAAWCFLVDHYVRSREDFESAGRHAEAVEACLAALRGYERMADLRDPPLDPADLRNAPPRPSDRRSSGASQLA